MSSTSQRLENFIVRTRAPCRNFPEIYTLMSSVVRVSPSFHIQVNRYVHTYYRLRVLRPHSKNSAENSFLNETPDH